MKKIFIILIIAFVGMNFTSCTQDSTVEEQQELIEQATEGSTGQVEEERDDDEG